MANPYLKALFDAFECDQEVKLQIRNQVVARLTKIKSVVKARILKISPIRRFSSKLKVIKEPEKPVKRLSTHEYLVEFDTKQKENQKFTKKLNKDKILRKEQKRLREEALKRLREQQFQEELKAKEQETLLRQQSKKELIEKLVVKSRERKNSLSALKELSEKEYKKVKSVTPLYKQLESSFISNYQLPELQKRKEFLRQKHEYFKPMDHETIKVHSKQVKKLKNSFSERKKFKVPTISQSVSIQKAKIWDKLVEEDEFKAQTELEKSSKKKKLLEKQKKYSELVKEIFQPAPDSFKQKEMELIRAKLEHPVSKKSIFSMFKDDEDKSQEKSLSVKQHRVKTIPKVMEKKNIVVKDYIQELRMIRERSMSNKNIFSEYDSIVIDAKTPENQKNLMKKIEVLDKAARKNEVKIGYLNLFDNKTIEATEHINTLLVNSIKAKIAILDKYC